MTIEKLKKFKMINIIIYGLIAAISLLVGIFGCMYVSMVFIVSALPFFVSLVLFICSFNLNIRRYTIGENVVLCYAGWEKHYLVVNGEIVDEHITGLSFTAIELSYKDEFHDYHMTVSVSNNIKLKVDGKLIREYTK